MQSHAALQPGILSPRGEENSSSSPDGFDRIPHVDLPLGKNIALLVENNGDTKVILRFEIRLIGDVSGDQFPPQPPRRCPHLRQRPLTQPAARSGQERDPTRH